MLSKDYLKRIIENTEELLEKDEEDLRGAKHSLAGLCSQLGDLIEELEHRDRINSQNRL